MTCCFLILNIYWCFMLFRSGGMASSTEVEVGMEKVVVNRKRTHDDNRVRAASPLPEVVHPLLEVVSTLPVSNFTSSLHLFSDLIFVLHL